MAQHWRRHRNQGMVIIFPTGLLDGGKHQWQHAKEDRTFLTRDVDFVKELVSQLTALSWIDSSRFYATGFSSGAGMAWQLMVDPQTSQLFRGYGMVSQGMTVTKKQNAADNPQGPKPVIYMHGTAESTWGNSGELAGQGPHDTVEWLLNLNQNDPLAVQEGCYPDLGGKPHRDEAGELQRDQTVVVRQHYPANSDLPKGGAAVTFLTIVGGGHSWPRYIDPPNKSFHCRDIDAADEIVRFWQEHAGL